MEEPLAPGRPTFTPHDHAALAAFHRDRLVLERGLGLGEGAGGGEPANGAVNKEPKALRSKVAELEKRAAATGGGS